ncbi:MAG: hypothetical protein BRC29_03465 [Nanohaloarchaea archaeon SW_7_43_1]|nr:MAG: hypothetical protein BRC29_03465 [Nanohaloarchaea archaeon SW_7_43_1]
MISEEEEDLPEPSDELTRPEKFLAERLTPYRVFWIKRITNLILIVAFLWAAWHLQGVFQNIEQLQAQLDQYGCSVLRDKVGSEVFGSGATPGNYTNYSATNQTPEVFENYSGNHSYPTK